jgi:putative glycosyltransferase (TIGR04348 family)
MFFLTMMRILIKTPFVKGVRTGNRSSAEQYLAVMHRLGHEAQVADTYDGQQVDWLIGLHAEKCAEAVADCRLACPEAKIAVVLTGTDIYPEPSQQALETMRLADRLVGLQPDAAAQVPREFRAKLRVIVQASEPGQVVVQKSLDPFDVCVVGHLRDVKDPMLTAAASRLLPRESKIRIRHAGAILDPRYEELVAKEMNENPRYTWLGQLGVTAVRDLISGSQLLVMTSLSEGAGRVVGSAIVKGTPVLSTRNHGVVGLVGEDYPGLFPLGDAGALAALLRRVESDSAFREALAARCEARKFLFEPERELAGWRKLLEGGWD